MSDPSFLEKTEDEIRKEVFEIGEQETGLSNFKSVGVLRGIFETITLLVARIYTAFLSPLLKQVDRRTATGFWLDVHGNNLGVSRYRETRTQGSFTGTAYASGSLKAGSWVRVEGSDLRFRVVQEISFLTGSFDIPVEAEAAGSEYNIAPGTPLILTSVTQGVESVAAGSGWITYSGTDDETDAAYRSRIDDRWNAQGEGNPPSKYELVARSVDGVAEAKVIRTPRGFGSIDVLIAGSAGLPTETQLSDVRDALDDYGMICRDLIVRAPETVAADVSIEFSGNYTALEVENAVRAWIAALGIGVDLEVRKLYSEPWSGWTFTSFEVLLPDRDVAVGENEIVVPTITVTKV
jgi:hypothetical protein